MQARSHQNIRAENKELLSFHARLVHSNLPGICQVCCCIWCCCCTFTYNLVHISRQAGCGIKKAPFRSWHFPIVRYSTHQGLCSQPRRSTTRFHPLAIDKTKRETTIPSSRTLKTLNSLLLGAGDLERGRCCPPTRCQLDGCWRFTPTHRGDNTVLPGNKKKHVPPRPSQVPCPCPALFTLLFAACVLCAVCWSEKKLHSMAQPSTTKCHSRHAPSPPNKR